MTPCDQITAQLVAYADGELPPAEAQTVKDHLATCAECQAALGRLERSLQAARRVWAEVATPVGPRVHARPYAGAVRAALALAATVLMAVTVWLTWPVVRHHPAGPEIAQNPRDASLDDVKESISRAGRAARLQASLEILASQPGMEWYQAEAERYYDRTFGSQASFSARDALIN